MTTVYLIRHGDTESPTEAMFRGATDFPLSDKGRSQAQQLAGIFIGKPVAAVFSSPARRAIETITPMANAAGLAVIQDEAFGDMRFGDWDGKTIEEVKQADPERFAQWVARPDIMVFDGEPTLAARVKTALAALENIAGSNSSSVVICTHRAIIKGIIRVLRNEPLATFRDLPCEAASLTELQHDGHGWQIVRFNKTLPE